VLSYCKKIVDSENGVDYFFDGFSGENRLSVYTPVVPPRNASLYLTSANVKAVYEEI